MATSISTAAHHAKREYDAPDIETSSKSYAARFAGTVGKYLLRVQERLVIELMLDGRPLFGRRILDVGGGHGQLAIPLAELGCKVMVAGSDISCAERIRATQERASIGFTATNLLDLPFKDRSFDTVLSVRLISHLSDWEGLIAELCRVADRSIIIDYPTHRSLNALSLITFPLKLAIEGDTRTYTTFRNTTIQRAFARHGFHARTADRQFVIPMGLHRAVNGLPFMQKIENALRRLGITKLLGNPVLIRFDRAE